MGYGICRVQKVKRSAVGSMQYHNDRLPGEHSNPNIDPEKRGDNVEFIEHGSYRAEVNDRIERFRKSGRKVRKDAVVLVEGVMTASPEFFEGKSRDEVMAFFKDGFDFVKSEAGEENMIHFTVHMDESTPHAHFGFTPIKDGTLAWKKFFDGRSALKGWQDRFFEKVSEPWGLERGEQDTGRTHRDAAQMRRDAERELRAVETDLAAKQQQSMALNNEIADKQGDLVELDSAIEDRSLKLDEQAERLEGLQRQIEDVQPAAVTLPESVRALVAGRGDGDRERELAAEKAELGAGIGELERQVAAARGRIGELERGLPALRARCERARERFELVEQRVTAAIGKLREVPNVVSDWAQEIARKLGKRIYDPRSLEHMARQAREVARGMGSAREWQPRQRRDWGAR